MILEYTSSEEVLKGTCGRLVVTTSASCIVNNRAFGRPAVKMSGMLQGSRKDYYEACGFLWVITLIGHNLGLLVRNLI